MAILTLLSFQRCCALDHRHRAAVWLRRLQTPDSGRLGLVVIFICGRARRQRRLWTERIGFGRVRRQQRCRTGVRCCELGSRRGLCSPRKLLRRRWRGRQRGRRWLWGSRRGCSRRPRHLPLTATACWAGASSPSGSKVAGGDHCHDTSLFLSYMLLGVGADARQGAATLLAVFPGH